MHTAGLRDPEKGNLGDAFLCRNVNNIFKESFPKLSTLLLYISWLVRSSCIFVDVEKILWKTKVSYIPYTVYYCFPQLDQHYSEKQCSLSFSVCYVLPYILHLNGTNEKQGSNCSSMFPWVSQHHPSDLATRVFHRTLHISRIKGLKFCPSSDVRVAQAWEAAASSVCFIPAESFSSTEKSLLINYSWHLAPLHHLRSKRCQISAELSVLSCSS